MKIFIRYGIAGILLLLAISGCRKSERDQDINTFASHDHAYAFMRFNDMLKEVHKMTIGNTALDSGFTNGNSLTCIDSSYLSSGVDGFPATLVIDYGEQNGAACQDGKTRRGKIIAKFSGKYRDSLSTITIRPYFYFVNDVQIEGEWILTNKGRNPAGNYYYSSVITNGIVTGDSIRIELDTEETLEWKSGTATGDVEDDLFLYTGKGTGRTTKGSKFSYNITEALNWPLNCTWISSGTLDMQPDNMTERKVNFGSGSCDNKITVTIIGKENEVTIE